MTDNDKKVLTFLAGGYSYEGFGFYSFAPIVKATGLDRRIVRLSCRRLTRKGLAEFCSGLWTDDGDLAGSGYACTKAGRDAIGDVPENYAE